jgi:starch synthase
LRDRGPCHYICSILTSKTLVLTSTIFDLQGGRGLHPTLLQHSNKFSGVLNGIDIDAWDPATDPLLEYQYNADDLDSKYANKYALRQKLGLSADGDDEGRPLVRVKRWLSILRVFPRL